MKNRYVFLFLSLTLLLAACDAPASGTGTDLAEKTLKLVQGYVGAYHALDADKYMSYFAEDAKYYDMGLKDFGAWDRNALDKAVHSTFDDEGFKVEIDSFFVSTDGKYAALEGTYYDLNKSGRQVGMPMVIMLDIQDGKIIKEVDYYDRSPIK